MDNQDKVLVVTAKKNLNYLISNKENSFYVKIISEKKFKKGMNLINFPQKNIFYIKKNKNSINIKQNFKNLEELKDFSFNNLNFGEGLYSNIVSTFHEHLFNIDDHKKRINETLITSISVYQTLCNLIKKHNPSFLYIFNGRFAETQAAINACSEKKITFYTHERGSHPEKYSLFLNSIPHSISYVKNELITINKNFTKDQKEIGAQWFIDRRNGKNQGWFSFTKDQKKNSLPDNFNPNKRNIAIFNSSINEVARFKEWNTRFYKDENEGIYQLLSEFSNQLSFHFYLRVHPNLKNKNNSQINYLKNLKFKNLTIIWPEDTCDSYQLIQACEKTLTFNSTIGVEANFWGKPSILIGRSFYEDLNCCFRPKNQKDLVKLIKSFLPSKDINGSLIYGYWENTKGIKYQYFQPNGLFNGSFLGDDLRITFNTFDKLKYKIKIFSEKINSFLNK